MGARAWVSRPKGRTRACDPRKATPRRLRGEALGKSLGLGDEASGEWPGMPIKGWPGGAAKAPAQASGWVYVYVFGK